jgi:uncharacterized protein involved in exopolysaccharide biosynthesis
MNDTGASPTPPVVYVVQGAGPPDDEGLSLAGLVRAVGRHRGRVLGATLAGTLLAAAYAFLAEPVYLAEAVLFPREARVAGGLSAQLAQLGGLADMAGIATGGAGKQEPLGVLRSRGFAARFIARRGLAASLAPDHPADDVRKAAEVFGRTVLSVFEDKRSGLVTVGIRWRDPAQAADWANDIVRQLNEEMRARALQESEGNIRYLREQLDNTRTVSLQESISRLLEAEMQKDMLARGTPEYAFRVVDPAEVPVRRAAPKRLLVVTMGFSLSLVAAVLVAGLAGPVRRLWAAPAAGRIQTDRQAGSPNPDA